MIKIVDYRAEHQPWFEKFNRAWIEKYFHMEEVDEHVLTQPEQYILKAGGFILIGYWNEEVAGAVALWKMKNGDYELTKMAVDEKFRGRGVGEALIHAVIDKARTLGLKRVILYSNRVLENAIRLYRRLGFVEIPLEPGVYERSDIKMEIEVTPLPAALPLAKGELEGDQFSLQKNEINSQ